VFSSCVVDFVDQREFAFDAAPARSVMFACEPAPKRDAARLVIPKQSEVFSSNIMGSRFGTCPQQG
jgi:hypothetical protein